MEGTVKWSAKVALCAFWLTGGLRKRGEIGGKALEWEPHSRFELPSPLQSAWCKLNEVPSPLPLHPSHSPSAERAHAGGWQRYNQFAIHRWPYFNSYVWKWHWLLTPTLAIRAKRNIWNRQRVGVEPREDRSVKRRTSRICFRARAHRRSARRPRVVFRSSQRNVSLACVERVCVGACERVWY